MVDALLTEVNDTKWILVCEYMIKCEQVWWTDDEDETSTSETRETGNMYYMYSVQYV